MKKVFKRSLSILLTLILVVTTFFIFDPSVLKIETEAFIDTEGNTTSSLSRQTAYAPETIWLDSAGTAFKQFANYSAATGTVAYATESSGTVAFSNADATNVKIGVNKIYLKGSSSMFDGTLKIGGTTVSTKANKTATNATDMSTFTAVATGTNSASVTMTASNSSLTGTADGSVYFIEWIVRYVINSTAHFTYMYTAIYDPPLGQAGMTFHSSARGGTFTSDVNHRGYSFITGAHAYGGGNRRSAFTSTTVSTTAKTAPLIRFVGIANDSTNYTIPGGSDIWNSTTYFPEQANGGVLTGSVTFSSSENDFGHFTIWTNYGTYENPTPSGTAYGAYGGGASFDYQLNGTTTGVAYINVDTSRFSNYNQIPNLSAGWAEFYHHWEGKSNCIDRIQAIETFTSNDNWATNGSDVEDFVKGDDNRHIADPVYCNVDSSDQSEKDSDNKSLARGLYPFNGNVRSGFLTIGYGSRNGYKAIWGVESESCYVLTTVGLVTATVDKASLRSTYCKATCSNIDYANCATASQNYTNFYNQLKAAGEALCDPTQTSVSSNSTLSGYVRDYSSAISATMDAAVYFYVPEVIYLTPSTAGTTTAVNFKFFADRANEDNGNVTADVASSITGNVYFHCGQASKFKLSVSKPTGSTVNVSSWTQDSWYNGSSKSTTMSGSAYNTTGQSITWTLTWEDTNGCQFTATRKSFIYKSNITAYGGAGRRVSGGHYAQGAAYMNGFSSGSSYTGGSYKMKDAVNTGLQLSWSYTGGQTDAISTYMDSQSSGPILYKNETSKGTNDMTLYSSSSTSLYYYIDRSRFTNYNQVPFIYWTILASDWEDTDDERWLHARYFETATAGNDSTPTANLLDQEGWYNDGNYWSLKYGKINAGLPAANTSATIHKMHFKLGGYDGRTIANNVTIYFGTYCFDKSGLREAYDHAVKYSRFLQQSWYTSAAWSAYTSALTDVENALLTVENSSVSSYSSYASALKSQVNKMIAAATAPAGATTFSYKNAEGTTVSNQTRSDVLKSSTAKVYHRVIRSSTTSYPLFRAISEASLINYEQKTYYYGENVITGFNSVSGYTHAGYKKGADTNSPSGYTAGETHTDYFVNEDNLSYTYYYNVIPEVTFDNQFDFDSMMTTAGRNLNNIRLDYATNTLKASTTKTDLSGSVYEHFMNDTSAQPMHLIGGHTYRFRYDFDTALVEDNTEYSATSGASSYSEAKQYTIPAPFASGEQYYVEFDMKGTAAGSSANACVYFYGESGYLQCSNKVATASDGSTITYGGGDGATNIKMNSSWVHYTITWTLGSSGNGNVNKFLLFRALKGTNTLYVKNVRFKKVGESGAPRFTVLTNGTNGTPGYYQTLTDGVTYRESIGTNVGGTTYEGTWTIPAARPDVIIRPGIGNDMKVGTIFKYSNIYVQDITNLQGLADDKTVPSTIYKQISSGSGIGTLPEIERSYYDFLGWYNTYDLNTGNGSGTRYTASSTMTSSNLHLYSKWEPSTFTITCDKQSGSNGTSAFYEKYSVGFYSDSSATTAITKVNIPNRSGYSFMGYYTEESGGGTQVTDPKGNILSTITNTFFTNDTTIYAYWIARPLIDRVTAIQDGKEGFWIYCRVRDNSGSANIGIGRVAFPSWTNWPSGSTQDDIQNWLEGDANANTAIGTAGKWNSSLQTVSSGEYYNYRYYVDIDAKNNSANSASTSHYESNAYTVMNSTHVYAWYTGTDFTADKQARSAGVDYYYHFNFTVDPAGGSWNNTTNNTVYTEVPGTTSGTTTTAKTVDIHEIANPERTGYTFDGWSFTGKGTWNNSSKIYTFGTTYSGDTEVGNGTLTATWDDDDFTLAYNVSTNGGSGGPSPATATLTYDTATTLSTAQPTRTGYSFIGWNHNSAATDSDTNYAAGASISAATVNSWYSTAGVGKGGTYTLYAIFKINPYDLIVKAYSNAATSDTATGTTYNCNITGGTVFITGATGSATSSVTKSINYQTTGTLQATPATGYAFIGWYKAPTLNSSNQITSESNWGTQWKAASACTESGGTYYATSDAIPDSAVTYYARFDIQKYTFKLYSVCDTATSTSYAACTSSRNGGKVSFSDSSYAYTASVTRVCGRNLSLYAQPQTGYNFDGWYYSNSTDAAITSFSGLTNQGKGSETSSGSGKWKLNVVTGWSTRVAENRYYTAKFSIKSYTVTAYGAGNTATNATTASTTYTKSTGGTVSVSSSSVKHGLTVTLTASPSTGYALSGWYTGTTFNASNQVTDWGTQATVTNGVTEAITDDTVFYAKFDIQKYSVTVYAQYNAVNSTTPTSSTTSWSRGTTGGTVAVSASQIYYGKTTTISATPASGYDFIGWYKSPTLDSSNAVASEANWNTQWKARTDCTESSGTYSVTTESQSEDGLTYYARFDVKSYTLYIKAMSNSATNSTTLTTWENNTTGGTVKFSGDSSGSQGANKNLYLGGTASIVATKATGYDFIGWYTSPTLNSSSQVAAAANWGSSSSTSASYTTAAMPADNITYYARFDIHGYTVTVQEQYKSSSSATSYANGTTGGTASGDGTVYYNNQATLTASAETGYLFIGWFTLSGSTYTNVSTLSPYTPTITADITYYARFDIQSYSVTIYNQYNAAADPPTSSTTTWARGNTGGTITVASSSIDYGTTTTLNAKAKSGYTFVGWYTSPTTSGTDVTAWGDTAWKTAEDCTYDSSTKIYSVTTESQTTSGLTYYARFDVKSYKMYVRAMSNVADNATTAGTTWSYNTTGGTVKFSGDATSSKGTSKSIYKGGKMYIVATKKTGYDFIGWYTSPTRNDSSQVTSLADWGTQWKSASECTNSGNDYTIQTAAIGTSNIAYYARFDIHGYSITVTAQCNTAAAQTTFTNSTDGGTVSGGNTYYYNKQATLTATAKTGYDFDGWYTKSGSTYTKITGAAASYSPTVTADKAYYARFTINSFNIIFDPSSGTPGSTTQDTLYYNTAYTIPVTANPTRIGYTFIGWAESQTATTPDWQSGGTITAATAKSWYETPGIGKGGNKTIYAVWEPITYDIILAAAYNSAENNTTYTIGNTGGTVTLASGVTQIQTADTIYDKLVITPATGYEESSWNYKVETGTAMPTTTVTKTSWGIQPQDNTMQMPPSETGSKLKIVVFFNIKSFNITVYAMTNSSTTGSTYTNSAAGGTVKKKVNGTPGATAQATGIYFNKTTQFTAAAATGYKFDGWYTTNTNGTLGGTRVTTADITVTAQDDSSNALINARYAAFSLNSFKAYGKAMYYNRGINDLDESTDCIVGANGGTVTLKKATSSSTVTTSASTLTVNLTVKYTEQVTCTATKNTGYDFIGWYISSDTDNVNFNVPFEAETVSENNVYSFAMPARDVRIIGKFVPAVFTLQLNKNASGAVEGAVSELELTYDQAVVLTSDMFPIYAGYTLLGWSNSPSGSVNYAKEGTIPASTVNSWYTAPNCTKIIYAVWQVAVYVVSLENLGGTGGASSVEVTLNNAMPSIAGNLPTYSGYKFCGYYNDTEYVESEKYYNSSGTSAHTWDKDSGGTLYAKWTCPILKDVTYSGGTWTYSYIATENPDTVVTKSTSTPYTTEDQITVNMPSGAKEITSLETVRIEPINTMVDTTHNIDLNHYKQDALEDLYNNVTQVNNNEIETQPGYNKALAAIAKDKEINYSSNRRTESSKPAVTVYDTSARVSSIASNILTAESSVLDKNYPSYTNRAGGNYTYAGKWANLVPDGVDYYIYTNSENPVIAVEIGDGSVAKTASANTSSYPTSAAITTQVNGNATAGITESAVKATGDIQNAWFYKYTEAGIGTSCQKDYNAKTVLYLTPDFSSASKGATDNEVVYNIVPKDDAYNPNTGMTGASLAEASASANSSLNSYTARSAASEIKICVCYHNSMSSTGDMGGSDPDDPYLQMYPDQISLESWCKQMHLFRTAGGASNWDFPSVGDRVYKVVDQTYPNAELGSFAYLFRQSDVPAAVSAFNSGDLEGAKDAVIAKIKTDISGAQVAITDTSDTRHYTFEKGLGFFAITGWSTNIYPKDTETYVYAHMVDRWGNVFNRVWKCFKVDSYASTIRAGLNGEYDIFEDGGSNLADIELDGASVEFILDEGSSYANGVFSTTGGSFKVKTGEANKTYNITIQDNAENKTTAKVKTDSEGILTFNVEDACMNLEGGSYKFNLNGEEVNLYTDSVVLSASCETSFVTDPAEIKVTTAGDVSKVQLVRNGNTITYTSTNAEVKENENGTLEWTLRVNGLPAGEYKYDIKAKIGKTWYETPITVKVEKIIETVETPEAIISAESAQVMKGERAVIKVTAAAGTEKIQLIYNGQTITKSAKTSENADGTEIWEISAWNWLPTGVNELKLKAKYDGKWQEEKTVTVTVLEEQPEETAVIKSVEVPETVKYGEATEIKVVTSDNTVKVQFKLPGGTTATYTELNAEVTANGDGTKTWTITRKFKTLGVNNIELSAKAGKSWTDSAIYATVSVER